MGYEKPNPINLERVRDMPKSFSWIDRRIITENFLHYLTKDETILYFFLVTVSDGNGMSFYGIRKTCRILGVSETDFHTALSGLKKKDLILFRFPFFQVLSLPERPVMNRETMTCFLERDQA